MSERLQLQSLEHSNLYKRRTTSKENLLQATTGEPTTMADHHQQRLYQNGPIRNPQQAAAAPLYSNVVPDKQQQYQQYQQFPEPSSSALLAADAIVRDLSSVSLGTTGNSSSTDRYQNVPPLASSTPVRRKMELREQSGRSNVEVIGLVWSFELLRIKAWSESFLKSQQKVLSSGLLEYGSV